jgi:arsenate reductase (thioredoxin)
VIGTETAVRKAFVRAFTELTTRINLLTSVPIDKLDRLTLQRKLAEIGKIGRESPVS